MAASLTHHSSWRLQVAGHTSRRIEIEDEGATLIELGDEATRRAGRDHRKPAQLTARPRRVPAVQSTTMTMAPRPARHRYSYDEYLAYERDSGMKHEYDDGEIFAMAGGSRRHNALALRVGAALENARKADCVAFQSDQRVRVLATGKATYPDASLVCGPIEGDPADPTGATITNPMLLVEVPSPSTEQDDRGNKWQHYQLIPSLQEYVLVSQSQPRVERYRRLAAGGWEYHDATEGTVHLLTGAVLDLARMYAQLPD
jgi:Uma2 family endonuclease